MRLLCRVNLELEGYRVLEATTLAEARAQLEGDGIDAMLLDVHVGLEDGFKLLRELRDRESDVRIALLTGESELTIAGATAADGVIQKPFTLDQLSETVRALLEADVDSPIT